MDPALTSLLDPLAGSSWPQRLDALSSALLGRPYLSGPLVGSPEEEELLVTRLDAFDCVTYVESVYALAASTGPEDFPARLALLRYHLGCVAWRARSHYTSDWLDRNVAQGLLRPLLEARWVDEPRTLSVLAGYPVRTRPVRWLPVDRVGELAVEPGDFAGFVSTRDDLDTFHVGLLFPGEDEPWLRHASRTHGSVVQVPLSLFLSSNETPGVLVARPLPPCPGGQQ